MSRKKSRRGEAREGTVRDVGRGGDAVVETAEGLVFAPGAWSGERVRLGGVRQQGKVARGRVVGVVEPSAARVEPACPRVGRCGGCPWMFVSLEAQRAQKKRFLEQALSFSDAPPPVTVETVGHALGYRRRARLAFEGGKGATRIGYRAARSRRIADVDGCPILEPALEYALVRVRERLGPRLEGTGEIRLARGAGDTATVALRSDDPQTPALFEAAAALADDPGVTGVALRSGGATADAVWGEPTEWIVGPDGEALESPVDGFSQAHDEVNRALVDRVQALAEPAGASVLELYAGHGNLTVGLAAAAARLTAVEQDLRAAEACRENLRRRGLRAKVVAGDADENAAGPHVDVVVLDPPRTGARGALDGILGRRPRRIVYVSCDTATLGRDLAHLAQGGYAPDAAHAFDMFPQTAHLESVVRMVREG